MRRFNPEIWSGVAMLAVMLLAASPVLFGGVPTAIPQPLWVGCFVVMLVTMFGALWYSENGGIYGLVYFGVVVLASWGLVLGAGNVGLVPVLLVMTVAVSPYFLPVWMGGLLVVANLIVLVLAFLPAEHIEAWFTEVSIMAGFYALIQVASLFSSVALIREQRARRELAAAHVDLQAASALLAESARANERLRISRDLHDRMGHQLTVLTLELEAAKHRRGEEVGTHVERADGMARELLSNIRGSVAEWRGEVGDLREVLSGIVQGIETPRVTLDIDDGVECDEDRTTLLVRAVQEIVTNSIRHAHADKLKIEVLRDSDRGVLLYARDNGVGSRTVTPGNGLCGLRERFESFGGGARFNGKNGFEIEARIPA